MDLNDLKERAARADKAVCDVAADPKNFKMTIPPQPGDTDELVVGVLRQVPFLVDDLTKAVKYLREGKTKFAPTTDNSLVDDLLSKYKDL